MKMISLSLTVVATVLCLTLAGCSTGPPSKEDIAEQLVDSGAAIDQAQADCIAEVITDADLSDDQLEAIADPDEAELSGEEVVEVGEVLDEALIACATG